MDLLKHDLKIKLTTYPVSEIQTLAINYACLMKTILRMDCLKREVKIALNYLKLGSECSFRFVLKSVKSGKSRLLAL